MSKPTNHTTPIIIASLLCGGAAAIGSTNPDIQFAGFSGAGLMGVGLTGSAGLGGWIISQLFAIRRELAEVKTKVAVVEAVVNERTAGPKISDNE